jgi:hypothetical protein
MLNILIYCLTGNNNSTARRTTKTKHVCLLHPRANHVIAQRENWLGVQQKKNRLRAVAQKSIRAENWEKNVSRARGPINGPCKGELALRRV